MNVRDLAMATARGRRHRRPSRRPRRRRTAQAKEQFFPVLVYRTGAYAPNGMPFANGYVDYLKLVNARDGGINGVKITFEECETGYATDSGVECYERLKGKGPPARRVPAAVHRHHLRADRQGARPTRSRCITDGLRPLPKAPTAACSSGTSRCSAPTGRPPTS